MSKYFDLTGKKINSFSVLNRVENKWRKARWLCQCECGKEVVLYSSELLSKNVKLCRECFMNTFIKHGKSKSKEHKCWMDMKDRCTNPQDKSYKNYGGRGIRYCKEWESFEAFYKHMGDAPSKKHSIERENVNGDYEPSNCKWATRKEQSINKRNTVFAEIDGVIKSVVEWCEIYNVDYKRTSRRVRNGMDIKEAIKIPLNDHFTKLSLNGKTMTLQEWEKETGLPAQVIKSRLSYGWSVEDSLTRPRRFIKNK